MKVVRKHVPLAVRVVVAERQMAALGMLPYAGTLGTRLKLGLADLFNGAKFELHHRPALENRPLNRRKTDHVPPANDPAFLVYLLKDEEHRIETYVRGQRGQLSDAGLRRKLKRMAKNRSPSKSRAKVRAAKRKRTIAGSNRWPPKGSRKLRWKR
jgi:hypothetical protein